MPRPLWLCLAACVLLAACTPLYGGRRAGALSEAPSASVQEVLPRSIAGAPETLAVTPQSLPPVIMAYRTGRLVHILSRQRWHGRTVDIYYLPSDNVVHRGDHLELRSARNVQRIARAEVRPDGSWEARWDTGSYTIPRHHPFYLLARDDAGEAGIVQINTFN
ncbi:MAG: hypothetical protein K6T81_17110 [Alicyclobacillus macrosporangiidus]|uniref:hypothetical protein n=1 Tax=Alicyclobacillus macrosporangiidus TaxID=392015 RepID=UPI0026EE395B|nr:hypothetical protein [Alicyclobacillus macrosporangiidus]MCL6600432.1 hypothetical protein [Alicyclobacillus macrosporangiidus]